MSDWAMLSIILSIVIIILLYLLYHEGKEKEFWEKEANKEHAIKSALEYACNYPTVTTDELDEIEPLIERIAKEVKEPYEYLSRVREAILLLYKEKQSGEGD